MVRVALARIEGGIVAVLTDLFPTLMKS